MYRTAAWGLAAALWVHPVTSGAQVTYDGCVDARGIPVASVRNDGLGDVAMATLVNGQPVIVYNAIVLSWQQPQTRLFWYGHECGHHALGHGLGGYVIGREQQADCFGITSLVRLGLLSDSDVSVVQQDLSRTGRGDWEHLPGPVRAINLRRCLAEAGLGGGPDDDGGPGPDDAVDEDAFEDVDESGDVYISDEDVTWNENPATPLVSFWFELTNDGEDRASCRVRVNLILVDRDTGEPERMSATRSYSARVAGEGTRRVRGSLRWTATERLHPRLVRQLSCED
jgi:hypothetical protein